MHSIFFLIIMMLLLIMSNVYILCQNKIPYSLYSKFVQLAAISYIMNSMYPTIRALLDIDFEHLIQF